MTLNERKNYLQARISQEKCLVHDAKEQIERSESELRALYGALETILEIEKSVSHPAAPAESKGE